MEQLTISEVARQVGLRPSAIRYYEQRKLLPRAVRVSGQRRYGMAAVQWLAVICRAQEAGFTLDEIRQLLAGVGPATPISARWSKLAAAKIAELDGRIEQIRSMKALLERLQSRCCCETIEECGAGILRKSGERRPALD